jgi:ABC-2 type transport system permease protein
MARRRRLGTVTEVVIVIAILVLANLISQSFFGRLDLTEGKVYSVSESTKKVLRNLDDIVNIKVYFSKKLPPYLTTLTRQVRDMIDEYRAYAGGNLVVDFEDPADNPEVEQRVRALGIPSVQLNIIQKDKAEVMNAYLGIAVLFEDRKQVIPVVENPSNLEYELTSAIVKVASREPKTVGFMVADESVTAQPYDAVQRSLSKQYDVVPVTKEDRWMVPPEVNTLIVMRPIALDDWDAFAIDQFIMRGGRALFLVDGTTIPEEGPLVAVPAKTGLDSLLVDYGVRVNPDIVVDRQCGSATFSTGFFRYTVPYVLWPMVNKAGFSEESPITNRLERVVFPWVSSIDTLATAGTGHKAQVLVKSSSQSWTETKRMDLNPQRDFTPTTPVEPRDLAVQVSGTFRSLFAGRQPPLPGEGEARWDGTALDSSPQTQMIAIGSSRFVESDYLSQYPENAVLFLNAVDWLTLGESLIGIRSRVVTARPLEEISEGARSSIRFGATFGIPILLIVWGLARRYTRSSRRRIIP